MYSKMILQFFLSPIISALPYLSIACVTCLVFSKLFFKIRANFDYSANCWFCNQNTKIPYEDRNSWNCPKCEQYNGFTKDGGYNREIFEQLDCSNVSRKSGNSSAVLDNSNGLCGTCNDNQRIKVEKLAQFEPKKESRFDEELKVFKQHLDQKYGLCDNCNRHVKKVLHEKKRMVLGSKFLEFIIKRAEMFKKPHLQFAKNQQKQRMKRLFTNLLITLTIISLLVAVKQISKLDKEVITSYLPDPIGTWIFIILSHALTIFKIITGLFQPITQFSFVQKISLFFKTIAFMTMYSIGVKTQHVSEIDISTVFLMALPFIATFFSLICVILDGFHMNRRILILTLWSCSAAGLFAVNQEIQMVVLSLFTSLAMVSYKEPILNKPTVLNGNVTNSSFHRIYSEDYMSECDNDTIETVNLLNEKLDSSMGDTSSVRSFPSTELFTRSDMHLNFNRQPSAFQPARSAFGSTIELNRNCRPSSAFDMNQSFAGALESLNVNEKFSQPQSPFSYSANTVYRNQANLLTPSRFSTSHLPSSATSNSSWLSGGYFNGQTRNVTSPKSDKVLDFLNKIQQPEVPTLSRGSSQSSGFESQFSSCREQEPETFNPRNKWDRPNPVAGSLLNLSALGVSRESLKVPTPNGRIYRPLSAMDMSRVPNSQNNPFNLNQINEEIPAAWDTLSMRSGGASMF